MEWLNFCKYKYALYTLYWRYGEQIFDVCVCVRVLFLRDIEWMDAFNAIIIRN